MDFYFAGSLFSHKDLIGNHLLAKAIEARSHGRFHALLPQDGPECSDKPLEVRDDDFALILRSDLALFNFDGDDVDSGTAAEFVAARVLDLPCVLLRTDFRPAGFPNADGFPWNLMMSAWPRTVSLWKSVLPDYTETKGDIDAFYARLADETVSLMEKAWATPPQLATVDDAFPVYRHWIAVCGGTLAERFPEDLLRALLKEKFARRA